MKDYQGEKKWHKKLKEETKGSRREIKGVDSAKGEINCMRVIITCEGWKRDCGFFQKKKNLNRFRREGS